MSIRGKIRRLLIRARHHIAPPGAGPVYLFHHIPKTAGSSVNRVLAQWFYRIRDYPERVNPDDWTEGHRYPPPRDLGDLRRGDVLAGHWDRDGAYLHQRYPEVLEDPRYRLFTFLRDPLETKLSLLAWEKRQGKSFADIAFREALLDRPNYLANRLPCDDANYRDVIDRYFFVGLTEHLQLSMDLLAELLDKPGIDVPHVNRSRELDNRREIPASLLRAFRQQNELDYRIYGHARARFAEELGLATTNLATGNTDGTRVPDHDRG